MNQLTVRLPGICSFLIVCGLLTAGLWPFHAPANEVFWLNDANGLRFGDHGTVLSVEAWHGQDEEKERGRGLELWLEPGVVEQTSTILAFDSPNSRSRFLVRQSDRDLELRIDDHHGGRRVSKYGYVDDLFRSKSPLFISMVSGKQGTAIYARGVLVKTIPQLRLSPRDFAGRLVVGNSPVENDSWSGRLVGLAFYGRELSPAEIFRHYETWTKDGSPVTSQTECRIALYQFKERAGNVAHNSIHPGIDLYIPPRFLVLHQKFLEAPWDGYHSTLGYWRNVLINVGGFVPLGFFFMAHLSGRERPRRKALTTIALGAGVSLTIETLQAFLPTRDSGVADLITNTIGTGVGVALFSCGLIRLLFDRSLSSISGVTFQNLSKRRERTGGAPEFQDS